MNKSIIIAGAIIGASILLNGALDRRYQDQEIDRCVAAWTEFDSDRDQEQYRQICLLKRYK